MKGGLKVIEIAYLEPDDKVRDDIIKGIEQLFALLGQKANVRHVKGAEEVVSDARNGRLDVFVCDLSLNTPEPLGIGVLSEVKEKCPGLFTMAVSGGNADILDIELASKRFDLFVPKVAITGRAFENKPNYVARLSERFRYSAVRTFSLQRKIAEIPLIPPPDRGEMLDLLRQVLSYRLPVDISAVISEIEMRQLGGGRSASYVFELSASMGTDKRAILPTIVKFSKTNEYLEEIRRYESFVKWTLPHQMRVDVLGAAASVGWGVVAYSFAHGESGLQTFREVLELGDLKRASVVIQKLFGGGKTFWNGTKRDIPYQNLPQRYFSRFYKQSAEWFNEDLQKIRGWAKDALPSLQMEGTGWKISGQTFPSWTRFLQTATVEKAGDQIWSIVHGDLNPGNIILSPVDDVALIDFRDTGIGHCYEDAITLEVAIRATWPWHNKIIDEKMISEVLDLESHLTAAGIPMTTPEEGWELVSQIRSHVTHIFDSQLRADYFYGLSYYCFRLLRVASLSDAAKLRLVLCGLSAAKQSDVRR
jgi:hypothetical protein